MNDKIVKLSKSPFIRSVAVMSIGTTAAQIISVILSPVITRMYGPEAFGIMGTFNSVINMIAPIAALTYPHAIVLPKSGQNARGLIRLAIIITGIIAIISLFVIILFNEPISILFQQNEVPFYLYLIPIVIIFSGLMQVLEQWSIRTKQFPINARATFLQSVLINGSKVGVGFYYPSVSVLVTLTALGNGLKALILGMFLKNSNYKEYDQTTSEENMTLKELAKMYNDFPLYRTPEIFLNALLQGLPMIMLTTFFGPASAGFYSIGWTVLSLPTRLVGQAVGDVFFPRISEAVDNKEDINKLIKKATVLLSGVGIIPFGLVFLFGPFLFSFIFGEDWQIAGEYARWIALFAFTNFINKPSVRALPVLNAQKFHLLYTIITLITRVLLLAIGFYIFSSDVVAIALFSVSGSLLNITLIIITLKLSQKKLL